MKRLMDEELNVIRERVEKATAGPWIKYDEHGRWICNYPRWDYIGETKEENDYDFITHARTDVPKLLAEIERLRAENTEMHDVLSNAYGEILRHKRGRAVDIVEEWGDNE